MDIHRGHQLQQAFVYTAQLFWPHVAVVHRHQVVRARGACPAQFFQGFEQVSIVQAGGVQVRALAGGKQASQCGQGQPGLTLVQPPEDDANGLPLVFVMVAGAAFEAEVAESGQCVAFGVGAAGSLRRGAASLWVQNPAFFHGKYENQPVHQSQQLLEVDVSTQ